MNHETNSQPNTQATKAPDTIRPTKKQQELLTYIQAFIEEHSYSPSYREIMSGLNYTSVATVSLHVNSLIKRGHLAKRDRSARSLEVIARSVLAKKAKVEPKQLNTAEEKWLVDKIEIYFKEAESAPRVLPAQIDHLYVLIGALKVLGVEGAAQGFMPRLTELKKRVSKSEYSV